MNYNLRKIIVQWLSYWWYPNIENQRMIIHHFFNKVDKWSKTKGDLWVISHLKEIRLLYTRFLCGQPVRQSKHIIGIRKDGLPKGFNSLNELARSGKPEEISFILTLLSLSRAIPVWPKKPDLSSITTPYTGVDNRKFIHILQEYTFVTPQTYKDFVPICMKVMKVGPFDVEWSQEHDYHFSVKSGPFGPATFTAPMDAHIDTRSFADRLEMINLGVANAALKWSMIMEEFKTETILRVFKLKKSKISEKWKDKDWSDLQPHQPSRRLSLVYDPEGKIRVIAIFDYFTQTIFKVIHDKLFQILKSIPQDRTFTQDPIVDFDGPYYSFDLSKATDRLPIQLQYEVLEYLIGESPATGWANLMVLFPLSFKGEDLHYKVGQPMGAYSSWAAFTLTHHVIVQYSAMLVGEFPTKNYILLGDDIVIGGKLLAESYQKVMSSFGVEISDHKSHISPNMYEFAKRWFKNGSEVSGIQISAFLETKDKYHLLYQVVKSYYGRGIVPRRFTLIPDLIGDLLIRLKVHQRLVINIKKHIVKLDALYSYIHQEESCMVKMRNLIISESPDWYPIPRDWSEGLYLMIDMRLRAALTAMFHSLADDISNYHDQMQQKFTSLMIKEEAFDLSDYGDEIELPPLLADQAVKIKWTRDSFTYSEVYSLPMLYSLRKVWQRLTQDARITEQPDWDIKAAISALSIPDVERLTESRNHRRVIGTTAKAWKEFIKYHKIFCKTSIFEQQYLFNLSERDQ